MKQITRYSGVILSHNTCLKIGSNAFGKKEEVMPVFNCKGKAEEAEKSSSSDWAENLAESNKVLLLRPGAMAEGVE